MTKHQETSTLSFSLLHNRLSPLTDNATYKHTFAADEEATERTKSCILQCEHVEGDGLVGLSKSGL